VPQSLLARADEVIEQISEWLRRARAAVDAPYHLAHC